MTSAIPVIDSTSESARRLKWRSSLKGLTTATNLSLGDSLIEKDTRQQGSRKRVHTSQGRELGQGEVEHAIIARYQAYSNPESSHDHVSPDNFRTKWGVGRMVDPKVTDRQ